MIVHGLFVVHVATLGYWLGSELVINSEFRYVTRASHMPFAERSRLMDHVMDVDQHVRYALVIQAGIGTMLGGLMGFFPGGEPLAWTAAALMLAWLALVEATHRRRASPVGQQFARIDRVIRYAVILLLLGIAAATSLGRIHVAGWLAWKLVAFAGVIACGLGIRFVLTDFFRTWAVIARDGSNGVREAEIRRCYTRATSVLMLLWALIAAIVVLSLAKPR